MSHPSLCYGTLNLPGLEVVNGSLEQSHDVLEPLEKVAHQSKVKACATQPYRKRVRVDVEQKNLNSEDMQANRSDYWYVKLTTLCMLVHYPPLKYFRNTIQPLDLAPRTIQLMEAEDSGNVDELFRKSGCSAIQDPGILRVCH